MTTATETQVELGQLAREDLDALRLADTVSFHHYPKRNGGFIRADLDGNSRIYTVREQKLFSTGRDYGNDRCRELAVETAMHGYRGRDGMGLWDLQTSPHATAFAMKHAAKYSDTWQTIVQMLKVGDVVSLAWIADNNNDNIRAAGLHRDEVYLVVKRGNRKLRFHLETSVCPNNSARMIHEHGA